MPAADATCLPIVAYATFSAAIINGLCFFCDAGFKRHFLLFCCTHLLHLDAAACSRFPCCSPGSGKTTLLRLVAGLEKPTGGRIFFDDNDATDDSVQERQIGFVFQSYALFNHKTVADNIKFGLQARY